jgi:hypothetical protein
MSAAFAESLILLNLLTVLARQPGRLRFPQGSSSVKNVQCVRKRSGIVTAKARRTPRFAERASATRAYETFLTVTRDFPHGRVPRTAIRTTRRERQANARTLGGLVREREPSTRSGRLWRGGPRGPDSSAKPGCRCSSTQWRCCSASAWLIAGALAGSSS